MTRNEHLDRMTEDDKQADLMLETFTNAGAREMRDEEWLDWDAVQGGANKNDFDPLAEHGE